MPSLTRMREFSSSGSTVAIGASTRATRPAGTPTASHVSSTASTIACAPTTIKSSARTSWPTTAHVGGPRPETPHSGQLRQLFERAAGADRPPDVVGVGRDRQYRHGRLDDERQPHNAHRCGDGEEDEEKQHVPGDGLLVHGYVFGRDLGPRKVHVLLATPDLRPALPAVPEAVGRRPDHEHRRRHQQE